MYAETSSRNRQATVTIRRIAVVLTTTLISVMLAGCSVGLGVNSDKDLKGTRTAGDDSYVGSYKADYKKFTGEETVFGGTGLKTIIHVSGTVTDESGTSAILVANGSPAKQAILVKNGSFDQTYNVDGVSFYVYVVGGQFTGSVNLYSKEQ